MSSTQQSPPKTPGMAIKETVQNGSTKSGSKSRRSGSPNAGNEPMAMSVSLAIREASDRSPVPSQPASTRASQGSVDLEQVEPDGNGVSEDKSAASQALEPFDWHDFEARYDQAIAKANETEAAILKEFHDTLRVSIRSSISEFHC